jgi:hypothetical protein
VVQGVHEFSDDVVESGAEAPAGHDGRGHCLWVEVEEGARPGAQEGVGGPVADLLADDVGHDEVFFTHQLKIGEFGELFMYLFDENNNNLLRIIIVCGRIERD